MTRGTFGLRAATLATVLLIRLVASAHAQSSSTPMLKLYVDPKTFAPVFKVHNHGAVVADAVPRDSHAFFLNMEFNY